MAGLDEGAAYVPPPQHAPNGAPPRAASVELQAARTESQELAAGLLFAHHAHGSADVPARTQNRGISNSVMKWLPIGTSATALVLAIVALVVAASKPSAQSSSTGSVSRVAFGSCTSYDLRPQPIWTQGVIPQAPDAWIWLGDMAYLDDAMVSCDIAPELCNCTLNYLRSTPDMCTAGDLDHARARMAHQLSSLEYRAFLDYMCPGAASAGLFPPTGSDPRVCPRPVLGVYDDHDFGWNNGNARLPNKDRYKVLLLDALGEPPDSPRRNAARGLWGSTVLNAGQAGREVQVVLLDERYERDALPCEMRRGLCTDTLRLRPADPWCRDFLHDDGRSGSGSCCFKDEQRAAWCSQVQPVPGSAWRAVCDPASVDFGAGVVGVTSNVSAADVSQDPTSVPREWRVVDSSTDVWHNTSLQADMWRWLVQDSPFCDMLGSVQWQWLRSILGITSGSGDPPGADAAGQAPVPALRLIASGSVPFGSMGYVSLTAGGAGAACSGDDWACYKSAQVHLLHTLGNATRGSTGGCVVILTGDYHHADIKVVMPGADHPYSEWLQTPRLAMPVYQVMASGLTDSTALGDKMACEASYLEDLMQLRPGGRCAYTPHPNFGMVSVDWDQRLVHLQVRDVDGQIATSVAGTALSLTFSLDTCLPVPGA